MRIILINREEPLGGLSIYTKRLEKYLRQYGHEVFMMSFTNKKDLGKNVFTIPYYIGEDNSFILLPKETSLNIIKKFFQEVKPDIVYTPIGLSSLDFLLPMLCRSENIPIIGVWHVDFSNEVNSYQLLIKSLFLAYLPYVKQLDLLHVFTDKIGQFYVNQGVEKNKILVLPNGVDYKKYSRKKTSDFKKEHNIEKGVVFVGRLSEEKNPELLIRSFLTASSNYPNNKLIIVGSGELEEELKEKYKNNKIIFTGLISDEEKLIDILSACQIFVLPSKFEGASLALLEAMSCKLACISSDVGSHNEILESAGIIISPSKLKTLLPFTLKLCLANDFISKHFGILARKKIKQNYSEKAIFNKLMKHMYKIKKNYQPDKNKNNNDILDISQKLLNRIQNIQNKIIKLGETIFR